ncbi:MAG TPA: methanogenesis marker protein Mmp4/MtxX [Candidatus Nanopelagicaceae bacterium]|nr:methanogenesis marker protein Mmp4/MtxX [Candidatus Nanopelagicaceae bacterium]
MSILEKFYQRAKGIEAKIGIGLGDSEVHNIKILKATISTLELKFNPFFLFGSRKSIDQIANNKHFSKNKEFITLVESDEPTFEILNYLKTNQISSVVRGNLSSTKFLLGLQSILNIHEINRLALLETYTGYQFFFGPVGIDECNDLGSKIIFVNKAIKEIKALNLEPKVSILSGGRIGDIGRNPMVDNSIEEAQKVVDHFRDNYSSLKIEHSEILIENAIAEKTNIIIAPNGISGNLIYRTLVHLGGGKAYGAIYMDINRAIVDTSRVGDISEIRGALILAQSLSSRYQSNSTKKMVI